MGFPTVKADRAFTALYETHVLQFDVNQVVEGELARFLVDTQAPVTVLDAGDQAAAGEGKPLDEMTAKQLKDHADSLGVDLTGAKKKDEIRAAIDAHIEAADAAASAAAAAAAGGDTGEGDSSDDDKDGEDGDGDGAAGDSA